ncbi:MAG TPA: hypothetical protein VGR13_03165 [Actinomycetota bacterium]|nr:hypothetical protein [Actinomycetota bacterium]
MERFAVIVALVAGLTGASCSQSAKTGGITTMDAPATRACSGLTRILRDRAAGTLSASDLRSRVGDVNSDAQSSTNPLIRARAVALFADVTVMLTGGDAGRLDADLAAMNEVCAGSGG